MYHASSDAILFQCALHCGAKIHPSLFTKG
jgi:hypothetical protein